MALLAARVVAGAPIMFVCVDVCGFCCREGNKLVAGSAIRPPLLADND
jgi:hypothetical protein